LLNWRENDCSFHSLKSSKNILWDCLLFERNRRWFHSSNHTLTIITNFKKTKMLKLSLVFFFTMMVCSSGLILDQLCRELSKNFLCRKFFDPPEREECVKEIEPVYKWVFLIFKKNVKLVFSIIYMILSFIRLFTWFSLGLLITFLIRSRWRSV